MWESWRMMPLSADFLGDLPFPPPFNSGVAPYSSESLSSALKTPPNLSSLHSLFRLHMGFVKEALHKPPLEILKSFEIRPARAQQSYLKIVNSSHHGIAVVYWLEFSHPTMWNRVGFPLGWLQDFRMWESCRTMTLDGGFSRKCPVSPALAFQRCSTLTSLQPHRLSRPRCYEQGKSLQSLTPSIPTLTPRWCTGTLSSTQSRDVPSVRMYGNRLACWYCEARRGKGKRFHGYESMRAWAASGKWGMTTFRVVWGEKPDSLKPFCNRKRGRE
ncbi:hypothetical protein PR048_009659 [Dryococelus australis]|uniref:Uncharacterized protein n=1 Tax=Dryococelus australis TaxID=614101 RepID=A0ABQ9I0X2_9NEOP|nr:hypothetical protein PR048_009659 [Dryococelus australis]